MPNWCINKISISGSTDKVKTLYKRAQTKGLLSALEEAVKTPLEGDHDDAQQAEQTTDTIELLEKDDDTAVIKGEIDSRYEPPIEIFDEFLEAYEDFHIHDEFICHEERIMGEYEDGCEMRVDEDEYDEVFRLKYPDCCDLLDDDEEDEADEEDEEEQSKQ
jgi:hypothetical protein